jgi:hypothetical protein
MVMLNGTMKEACNPSYLGSRDQKHLVSRTAWARCCETPISTNGCAWWHVPVIPVIQSSTNKRIIAQASQSIKLIFYLKNNPSKKGW